MNNIFNYSRPLPEPFDTLTNKKVSVSSKYGDGTNATLCSTVIKAVHAVCRCMDGSAEGAVGVIDHRTVAEYKSSMGPDEYHLVCKSNTIIYIPSVICLTCNGDSPRCGEMSRSDKKGSLEKGAGYERSE